MVPAATATPKQQAWIRAINRATVERIVVYRISPTMLGVASVAGGRWTRKPYTVTITGTRAQDAQCDCLGGQRGQTCKHLAAAVYARKHHVYAVKPTPAHDPLGDCFA